MKLLPDHQFKMVWSSKHWHFGRNRLLLLMKNCFLKMAKSVDTGRLESLTPFPDNSGNLLLMSSLAFFSKTLFQCLLQILDMARRGKCLCFRKEGKHPQYEKCIVDIGIWLEKLKCKTKSAPHKVCAVLTSLLFVNNLYGRHFNSWYQNFISTSPPFANVPNSVH